MSKVRPTRGQDIRCEMEQHPGREYTIDMLMHALGYKEWERTATGQALVYLVTNGEVIRSRRGRYLARVAAQNGATPVPESPELLAGVLAEPEPEPEPESVTLIPDEPGTVTITHTPAMFTEYIETVHVIGRSKTGQWIGVGMSDNTLYRLEEL